MWLLEIASIINALFIIASVSGSDPRDLSITTPGLDRKAFEIHSHKNVTVFSLTDKLFLDSRPYSMLEILERVAQLPNAPILEANGRDVPLMEFIQRAPDVRFRIKSDGNYVNIFELGRMLNADVVSYMIPTKIVLKGVHYTVETIMKIYGRDFAERLQIIYEPMKETLLFDNQEIDIKKFYEIVFLSTPTDIFDFTVLIINRVNVSFESLVYHLRFIPDVKIQINNNAIVTADAFISSNASKFIGKIQILRRGIPLTVTKVANLLSAYSIADIVKTETRQIESLLALESIKGEPGIKIWIPGLALDMFTIPQYLKMMNQFPTFQLFYNDKLLDKNDLSELLNVKGELVFNGIDMLENATGINIFYNNRVYSVADFLNEYRGTKTPFRILKNGRVLKMEEVNRLLPAPRVIRVDKAAIETGQVISSEMLSNIFPNIQFFDITFTSRDVLRHLAKHSPKDVQISHSGVKYPPGMFLEQFKNNLPPDFEVWQGNEPIIPEDLPKVVNFLNSDKFLDRYGVKPIYVDGTEISPLDIANHIAGNKPAYPTLMIDDNGKVITPDKFLNVHASTIPTYVLFDKGVPVKPEVLGTLIDMPNLMQQKLGKGHHPIDFWMNNTQSGGSKDYGVNGKVPQVVGFGFGGNTPMDGSFSFGGEFGSGEPTSIEMGAEIQPRPPRPQMQKPSESLGDDLGFSVSKPTAPGDPYDFNVIGSSQPSGLLDLFGRDKAKLKPPPTTMAIDKDGNLYDPSKMPPTMPALQQQRPYKPMEFKGGSSEMFDSMEEPLPPIRDINSGMTINNKPFRDKGNRRPQQIDLNTYAFELNNGSFNPHQYYGYDPEIVAIPQFEPENYGPAQSGGGRGRPPAAAPGFGSAYGPDEMHGVGVNPVLISNGGAVQNTTSPPQIDSYGPNGFDLGSALAKQFPGVDWSKKPQSMFAPPGKDPQVSYWPNAQDTKYPKDQRIHRRPGSFGMYPQQPQSSKYDPLYMGGLPNQPYGGMSQREPQYFMPGQGSGSGEPQYFMPGQESGEPQYLMPSQESGLEFPSASIPKLDISAATIDDLRSKIPVEVLESFCKNGGYKEMYPYFSDLNVDGLILTPTDVVRIITNPRFMNLFIKHKKQVITPQYFYKKFQGNIPRDFSVLLNERPLTDEQLIALIGPFLRTLSPRSPYYPRGESRRPIGKPIWPQYYTPTEYISKFGTNYPKNLKIFRNGVPMEPNDVMAYLASLANGTAYPPIKPLVGGDAEKEELPTYFFYVPREAGLKVGDADPYDQEIIDKWNRMPKAHLVGKYGDMFKQNDANSGMVPLTGASSPDDSSAYGPDDYSGAKGRPGGDDVGAYGPDDFFYPDQSGQGRDRLKKPPLYRKVEKDLFGPQVKPLPDVGKPDSIKLPQSVLPGMNDPNQGGLFMLKPARLSSIKPLAGNLNPDSEEYGPDSEAYGPNKDGSMPEKLAYGPDDNNYLQKIRQGQPHHKQKPIAGATWNGTYYGSHDLPPVEALGPDIQGYPNARPGQKYPKNSGLVDPSAGAYGPDNYYYPDGRPKMPKEASGAYGPDSSFYPGSSEFGPAGQKDPKGKRPGIPDGGAYGPDDSFYPDGRPKGKKPGTQDGGAYGPDDSFYPDGRPKVYSKRPGESEGAYGPDDYYYPRGIGPGQKDPKGKAQGKPGDGAYGPDDYFYPGGRPKPSKENAPESNEAYGPDDYFYPGGRPKSPKEKAPGRGEPYGPDSYFYPDGRPKPAKVNTPGSQESGAYGPDGSSFYMEGSGEKPAGQKSPKGKTPEAYGPDDYFYPDGSPKPPKVNAPGSQESGAYGPDDYFYPEGPDGPRYPKGENAGGKNEPDKQVKPLSGINGPGMGMYGPNNFFYPDKSGLGRNRPRYLKRFPSDIYDWNRNMFKGGMSDPNQPNMMGPDGKFTPDPMQSGSYGGPHNKYQKFKIGPDGHLYPYNEPRPEHFRVGPDGHLIPFDQSQFRIGPDSKLYPNPQQSNFGNTFGYGQPKIGPDGKLYLEKIPGMDPRSGIMRLSANGQIYPINSAPGFNPNLRMGPNGQISPESRLYWPDMSPDGRFVKKGLQAPRGSMPGSDSNENAFGPDDYGYTQERTPFDMSALSNSQKPFPDLNINGQILSPVDVVRALMHPSINDVKIHHVGNVYTPQEYYFYYRDKYNQDPPVNFNVFRNKQYIKPKQVAIIIKQLYDKVPPQSYPEGERPMYLTKGILPSNPPFKINNKNIYPIDIVNALTHPKFKNISVGSLNQFHTPQEFMNRHSENVPPNIKIYQNGQLLHPMDAFQMTKPLFTQDKAWTEPHQNQFDPYFPDLHINNHKMTPAQTLQVLAQHPNIKIKRNESMYTPENFLKEFGGNDANPPRDFVVFIDGRARTPWDVQRYMQVLLNVNLPYYVMHGDVYTPTDLLLYFALNNPENVHILYDEEVFTPMDFIYRHKNAVPDNFKFVTADGVAISDVKLVAQLWSMMPRYITTYFPRVMIGGAMLHPRDVISMLLSNRIDCLKILFEGKEYAMQEFLAQYDYENAIPEQFAFVFAGKLVHPKMIIQIITDMLGVRK